jgi:hypothetical protein
MACDGHAMVMRWSVARKKKADLALVWLIWRADLAKKRKSK